MPYSEVAEWALRAAVSTNSRNLDTENHQETLKGASTRAEELLSNGANEGAMSKLRASSEAIALAVAGIAIAYSKVHEIRQKVKQNNLSFEQEISAHVAMFFLPTNKVSKDLSSEEKMVKSFYDALAAHPPLLQYSGIHVGTLSEKNTSKFFSVLPFYRMSTVLEQPVDSEEPLEKERMACFLFLKTEINRIFGAITHKFQHENGFGQFWRRVFKGSNYLNNHRAPRFILMSLANILWNLQHPVNENGFQLTTSECIKLCRLVEKFLNAILNPDSISYLPDRNWGVGFNSFLNKMESQTKTLRMAFEEAHLREINFREVTKSAHEVLRIMDRTIFKLIYKNQLTETDEPICFAEQLAGSITFLRTRLMLRPELLKYFKLSRPLLPAATFVNNPPVTVIDILIIFCHLASDERDILINKLENDPEKDLQFIKELKRFDEFYLQPLDTIHKKECGVSFSRPKKREVATLTAKRIIPLIALLLQDFPTNFDFPFPIDLFARDEVKTIKEKTKTSSEQIQLICKNAEAKHQDNATIQPKYYEFNIAPLLTLNTIAAEKVNDLPQAQNRMAQVAKLLDNVKELVNTYRHFLQDTEFQKCLIRCIKKVKQEIIKLNANLSVVDNYLARDEKMNRTNKATLTEMIERLEHCLVAFKEAAIVFEQKISAPDFTEQQRQKLTKKIGAIDAQFKALFGEESGISIFANGLSSLTSVTGPQVVEEVFCKPAVKRALRSVIVHCLNAMSYISKEGPKGAFLRSLLDYLDNQPALTQVQLRRTILEIARLTACFRETFFAIGEADYAKTRSGSAFIQKILDPALNQTLPLAATIFDDADIEIETLTKEEVIQRVRRIRANNDWAEAASSLRTVPAI